MRPTRNQRDHRPAWSRRDLLANFAAFATFATVEAGSLRTAPIELGGDWAGSLPGAVMTVLTRTRALSLMGVPLMSDRQPQRLEVDNTREGLPHIWLHFDDVPKAQIVLDVGERDWSKLAYQFGHEFGHVLANGWLRDTHPGGPSQWLEEALVEAFSLRGLGLLATSWEVNPLFPNDSAFGGAVRRYRDNILSKYSIYAGNQGALASPAAWYRERKDRLASSGGMSESCEALVPLLLGDLAADPNHVGEIGALNRWPEHSSLSLEPYLDAWKHSCQTLGAPGALVDRIRAWLIA